MVMSLEPVRAITMDEIERARERIARTVVRTPLLRLETGAGGLDIRLKLENLQPTNSYKLRGAVNAVAMLPEAARQRGVWTISAGNAGQGIAYAARQAGVSCSVVVIETAPAAKVARMKALGARLIPVPYEVAWKALDEHAFPGMDGTFVHPFDNHNFIAGHATLGLEILEDAPDTAAVIAAIGGGGLITGIASAIKARKPVIKVFGAEPETAAPASLDQTRQAMRLMAEKTRVVAEGAGALALAAALTGNAGPGPIVAVVSGGNIDLQKFCEILESSR